MITESIQRHQWRLAITQFYSMALLLDLETLQSESTYPLYFPAMVERCEELLSHLERATDDLWSTGQSSSVSAISYWMIHALVHEDIAPTFRALRSPIPLDATIADDLLKQIITRVAEVHRVLGLVPVQNAFYS